jgi:hypothetical protein
MLLALLAVTPAAALAPTYEYAVFDNGSLKYDMLTWDGPDGLIKAKTYPELFAALKCQPKGAAAFPSLLNCVGALGWKLEDVRYSGDIDRSVVFSRPLTP